MARAGFVELVDGTAPWIVLGLAIAAAAEPWLVQMLWAQWSDVLEVAVFALLGMPIYVCAAGATPLIAVLLAAGVSPGAALAFLLTGPATNACQAATSGKRFTLSRTASQKARALVMPSAARRGASAS